MTVARLEVRNWFLMSVVLCIVLWLLVFGLAMRTYGQESVCVGDPVMPMESRAVREGVRQQAVGWLKQKHNKVMESCRTADLEFVIEPVEGQIDTGQYYFDGQILGARAGLVNGTVKVTAIKVPYSGWTVVIFPKHGLSRARVGGSDLRKTLEKAIRLVDKQQPSDGKRS